MVKNGFTKQKKDGNASKNREKIIRMDEILSALCG